MLLVQPVAAVAPLVRLAARWRQHLLLVSACIPSSVLASRTGLLLCLPRQKVLLQPLCKLQTSRQQRGHLGQLQKGLPDVQDRTQRQEREREQHQVQQACHLAMVLLVVATPSHSSRLMCPTQPQHLRGWACPQTLPLLRRSTTSAALRALLPSAAHSTTGGWSDVVLGSVG